MNTKKKTKKEEEPNVLATGEANLDTGEMTWHCVDCGTEVLKYQAQCQDCRLQL